MSRIARYHPTALQTGIVRCTCRLIASEDPVFGSFRFRRNVSIIRFREPDWWWKADANIAVNMRQIREIHGMVNIDTNHTGWWMFWGVGKKTYPIVCRSINFYIAHISIDDNRTLHQRGWYEQQILYFLLLKPPIAKRSNLQCTICRLFTLS